MTFSEKLNEYIILLDCTSKELADASGLSASVLSRYRSGSHSPDAAQCGKLAAGIAALVAERGLEEITRESVETAFRDALTSSSSSLRL